MQPTKLPTYTITPAQLVNMKSYLAAARFTVEEQPPISGVQNFHLSGPYGIVGDATYYPPTQQLNVTITHKGLGVTLADIQNAIQTDITMNTNIG